MQKRWKEAISALLCLCSLVMTAVLMNSPLGSRLLLSRGLAGAGNGGSVHVDALVSLMMPNFVSGSGHTPIFTVNFWESFFEPYQTMDDILTSLSQDEVFAPMEGRAVIRTDMHPTDASGYENWGGGYIRNKSMMSYDVESLMQQPLTFEEKKGPKVLIYHTHSREAYNNTGDTYTTPEATHTTDKSKNVVAVGEVLAQTLMANGIETIHCTDIFDSTYTGAYARSEEGVASILEKYPSICVVLDLHRDAIYTADGGKYRPVVEKDGMDVAQIMMIAGTGDEGSDANPHWEENIRFGLTLQSEVEKQCPGITRAMMVRTSSYNQDRSKGALLIEVGTTGNTLTEAKRSAYYIGQALVEILG